MASDLTPYRLPDGRIVWIREDVARGALLIDFTLKGGTVVYALRLNPADFPNGAASHA